MRGKLRWCVVAVLCGGLTAGSPQAVRAECLEVDFAVHRSGQPDWYPLGPDYCVTDTPWNQTDSVFYDDKVTGLPTGTPNGVWLEVWYTSP